MYIMSTHDLPSLATLIRAARERMGLTQRELSTRVGIPQSHISKIEQGRVDLQTSNLMQIARALDLELALVPRNVLPAVETLSAVQRLEGPTINSQLSRKIFTLRMLARKMRERFPKVHILQKLTDSLVGGDWVRLVTDQEQVHRLSAALQALQDSLRKLNKAPPQHRVEHKSLLLEIESGERTLRDIRNSIVHGQGPKNSIVKPAYQLDEEEELPAEPRDG
jgi:transcriptional regulator with XRE-family HTH domain